MTTLVEIDGNDVTNLSLAGSSTRRLNRMSQAQVTLPMEEVDASWGTGSRLKVTFDGNLHHHGIVMLCETEAGEDTGTTVFNSRDPLDIWSWRPVRDDDGDYTKPGITWDPAFPPASKTGPQIIEQMMDNSENAMVPSDNGFPDGPLLLARGNFASGGVDLSGAPTDWPMTMADLASLLTSTGELDIVITPIDTDIDGNIGQIDCYNGNYGDDLSTVIAFQYGMGQRNIRALRHNEDATNVISKLRYLLGPRVQTSADPAGDQHWRTSVDTGGPNVPDLCDYETEFTYVEDLYGGRFDIRIFDGDDIANAKELYLRLFALEACLRSIPRLLVHITPTRETEIFTFDIGDVITVEAAAVVRGGFSGEQRVYGYTIAWEGEDSVRYLSELTTSPDQEGLV